MSKRRDQKTTDTVLEAIRKFILTHGFSPSMDDIAKATGKSKSSIYYQIGVLEREGRIHRTDGVSRSIVLQHKE